MNTNDTEVTDIQTETATIAVPEPTYDEMKFDLYLIQRDRDAEAAKQDWKLPREESFKRRQERRQLEKEERMALELKMSRRIK